jgi:phenylalanyl-tRNA synthetase alpha subunit
MNEQSIISNVTMLANTNYQEVWLRQCFARTYDQKINCDDDRQSRPCLRNKSSKSSIATIHGNTQSCKINHDENHPIKIFNQEKLFASDQDDLSRND